MCDTLLYTCNPYDRDSDFCTIIKFVKEQIEFIRPTMHSKRTFAIVVHLTIFLFYVECEQVCNYALSIICDMKIFHLVLR